MARPQHDRAVRAPTAHVQTDALAFRAPVRRAQVVVGVGAVAGHVGVAHPRIDRGAKLDRIGPALGGDGHALRRQTRSAMLTRRSSRTHHMRPRASAARMARHQERLATALVRGVEPVERDGPSAVERRRTAEHRAGIGIIVMRPHSPPLAATRCSLAPISVRLEEPCAPERTQVRRVRCLFANVPKVIPCRSPASRPTCSGMVEAPCFATLPVAERGRG